MKIILVVLVLLLGGSLYFGYSFYQDVEGFRINAEREREEFDDLEEKHIELSSDYESLLSEFEQVKEIRNKMDELRQEKRALELQLKDMKLNKVDEASVRELQRSISVLESENEAYLEEVANYKQLESDLKQEIENLQKRKEDLIDVEIEKEDELDASGEVDLFYASASEQPILESNDLEEVIEAEPKMELPTRLPSTGQAFDAIDQTLARINRESDADLRVILRYYAYLEAGMLEESFGLLVDDGRSFESFKNSYEGVLKIDLSEVQQREEDMAYQLLVTYSDEIVEETVYRMVIEVIDKKIRVLASWHIPGTGRNR